MRRRLFPNMLRLNTHHYHYHYQPEWWIKDWSQTMNKLTFSARCNFNRKFSIKWNGFISEQLMIFFIHSFIHSFYFYFLSNELHGFTHEKRNTTSNICGKQRTNTLHEVQKKKPHTHTHTQTHIQKLLFMLKR